MRLPRASTSVSSSASSSASASAAAAVSPGAFTLALAVLLVIGPAGRAVAGDGIALTVEIGRKSERNVGNATGWFCDDPTLVDAALVTRGDKNYWVVTGQKVGSTQCRVGTDPARASFVFDVTVKRSSTNRRR